MAERRPALLKYVAAAAIVLAAALALVAQFGPGSQSASAAIVPINAGGTSSFWFCSGPLHNQICETTVNVDDTVRWHFPGNVSHTTTECASEGLPDLCGSPLSSQEQSTRVWASGTFSSAGDFDFTFNTPGTYQYQCNIHPTQMKGRIVVIIPPTPTITNTPSGPSATPPTPVDNPTPTDTPTITPTRTPTPGPSPTPGGPSATPLPPTPTRTPTPPSLLVGDASGDGVVNAIDAALVLQKSAGLLVSLPNEPAADANQDGTVNAIDATLILQFVADLLDHLPP